MPFDVLFSKDCRYGLAEQTVWGTAQADAGAFVELDCEPIIVPNGVAIRRQNGSHGSRFPLQADVMVDQYAQLLKVGGFKADAKKTELDLLVVGAVQQVTEGATTPYPKTLTWHPSQPDFTNGSLGYTLTLCERDPVAAHSWKAKDVVVEKLTLGSKSGEFVKVACDFVGRGAPVTSTPSGTWTRGAADLWFHEKLARATINFGGGAQAVQLTDWELAIVQKVEGVGQETSGDYLTYGLFDKGATIKFTALKDANIQSGRTNLKAGTVTTFNVGWGNATPGVGTADLDVTAICKLTDVEPVKGDPLKVVYTGELLGADAATSPLTIIISNAVDRTW